MSKSRILLLLAAIALVVWGLYRVTSDTPPRSDGPALPAPSPEVPEAELQGRAPLPAAEEASSAPVPPEGVQIVGHVHDGRTPRGVAGARVAASCPGREDWETTTTAEGAFTLLFGAHPKAEETVSLLVRAPDGRATCAAAVVSPGGPDVVDVGTLVLRAAADLYVKAVRAGEPVPGASVYVSSRARRYAPRSGFDPRRTWPGFAHQARTDETGGARLEGVPEGALRVLVLTEDALRGERFLVWKGGASPVVVELGEGRNLVVTVVRKESGEPVPDCALVLDTPRGYLEEPGPPGITDADGMAILRGVPNDITFRVSVIGPEWHSAYIRDVTKYAEPDTREMRVEIPAPLELRIPVVVVDGPALPDGLRVPLEQVSRGRDPRTRLGLSREGVVEGNELVVALYHIFHERATARLPDGRVGTLRIATDYDKEAGRSTVRLPLDPIVFTRSRSIEVEVVERETGAPAVGVSVRPFLKLGDRSPPPALTNVEGRVTLTGLPAVRGWVSVCSNPDLIRTSRQGVFSQRIDVDLTERDAGVRFDVPAVTTGVLHVTAEGRPGFPPGFQVELWMLSEGLTWRTPPGVVYDTEASEVRFRVRPPIVEATPPANGAHRPGTMLLRVSSDAYATEHVRMEAGKPLVATVDLLPAGSLRTHVVKPEGSTARPRLEQRSADGGWGSVWNGPVRPYEGERGDLYLGLRPGRYRLHDGRLSLTSVEVYVRPGPEPTDLYWDLTHSEFAEGEILFPAGVEPQGADVFVLPVEGPPRILSSASATPDGRFRVHVPGDVAVYLRPRHLDCIPDPDQERVVLTKGRSGVRLRMVRAER